MTNFFDRPHTPELTQVTEQEFDAFLAQHGGYLQRRTSTVAQSYWDTRYTPARRIAWHSIVTKKDFSCSCDLRYAGYYSIDKTLLQPQTP